MAFLTSLNKELVVLHFNFKSRTEFNIKFIYIKINYPNA